MSDPVTHFVESAEHAKTPCGLPIKDGQLFFRGRALSATTVPSAVTCDGCAVRADEVRAEQADRAAKEDEMRRENLRENALEEARQMLRDAGELPPS